VSELAPSPCTGAPAALDTIAGLDRMMGDRAMYLRVLARFRADYAGHAARLRAALAAGDMALANRIAHTVKGAAAMIEAHGLHALAMDVEEQLRANAFPEAQLVDRLEVELARVIAQMNALLAPVQDQAPVGEAPLADGDLARLGRMLDLGDGGVQDFVAGKRAGLCTRLGAARMAELEAAMAAFDFERALGVLGPVLEAGEQPSG